MIEQILAHRDTIPYALAVAAIILSMAMGYKLADKDPAEVCSEYIIQVDQLKKQVDDLTLELAECKAKGAGQTAIDCQTKIKVAVSKALKDYKEVVCSD